MRIVSGVIIALTLIFVTSLTFYSLAPAYNSTMFYVNQTIWGGVNGTAASRNAVLNVHRTGNYAWWIAPAAIVIATIYWFYEYMQTRETYYGGY